VILKIRDSFWRDPILFLLTINLINLTVNFSSRNIILEDPVDTISEMIYEWCLDGESDVIPDTDTDQEDQNLKALKIFWSSEIGFIWRKTIPVFIQSITRTNDPTYSIFLSLSSPPPDSNFF
jgi:hypothetical protein